MTLVFLSPGHIKFWKKKAVGIEFAKHFRSHLGPIEGLAVSTSSSHYSIHGLQNPVFGYIPLTFILDIECGISLTF